MNKRKLDPKIIRVGDTVKVVTPILFIRCGYPLSLADVEKEVEELFGNVVEDFLNSMGGDHLMLRDEKGKYEDGTFVGIIPNPSNRKKASSKSYKEIIKDLANTRMKVKGFGGIERTLHTETYEAAKGHETTVDSVKIVKTGQYQAASGGYDYYGGEYEYEPPYLDDEKTHKILTLNLYKKNPTEDEKFSPIKIEAVHVEKVKSKSDDPRDIDNIMIDKYV